MNPKIRNALAEAVAVLGIAYAAIPTWAAVVKLPPWLGLALTLAITIGNQLLKDSTPHPGTPAPSPTVPTDNPQQSAQ